MNAIMTEQVVFPENNEQLMVLKKSEIKVFIQAPTVETQITQHFINRESQAIEAVYTFPLPLESVLLDIRVKLDDKLIRGQIQKKAAAIEGYEEAITKGDTAVLLEKVDEGLFTLNLGNLLAGQKAEVTIIYSQLLHWLDKEIRYVLPTVIAPRYGYSPLEPQQQPDYDFRAEYPLIFEMKISGQLSNAAIHSPTHPLKTHKDENSLMISLNKEAFLDRDFVVNFVSTSDKSSYAVAEKDEQQYAVIASFKPELPVEKEVKRQPRSLNIVVDCSGSMQGDSINQARQALLLALDELQAEDYFSVLRFGSTTEKMTDDLIPATRENIALIRRRIRHMQADLGGTEIYKALTTVMSQRSTSYYQDLFLITDGEVWGNDELSAVSRQLKKRAIRVFSIGVGSAVSEKLVRKIAQDTGGACEFVTPGEEMVNKIHRHFKRIFKPVFYKKNIHWGQEVLWQSELPALFPGDQYTVYALLKDKPVADILLTANTDNDLTISETLHCELKQQDEQSALTRMVINQQLMTLDDDDERGEMAVIYQLMDDTTAFLMVEVNSEREGDELPVFRKVQQMMAAGWGGSSSVLLEYDDSYCDDTAFISYDLGDEASYLRKSYGFESDFINSKVLYKKLGGNLQKEVEKTKPQTFIQHLDAFIKDHKIELQLLSLDDLLENGLPDEIADDLSQWLEQVDEQSSELILWFVYQLALKLSGRFNGFCRQLGNASHSVQLKGASRKFIGDILEDVSEYSW